MFERSWIATAPKPLQKCLSEMGVSAVRTVYVDDVELSGEDYIYDRDVLVHYLAGHIGIRRMRYQMPGSAHDHFLQGIASHSTHYVLTAGHPINEGSNGRYVHTPPSDAYLATRRERE